MQQTVNLALENSTKWIASWNATYLPFKGDTIRLWQTSEPDPQQYIVVDYGHIINGNNQNSIVDTTIYVRAI
jgi:hypothetical protein